MTIHEELAKVSPGKETALTIGTFDGVHLGHQQLLRQLRDAAVGNNLLPGVLTFRNHPRSVLDPINHVGYISPLAERLSRLSSSGIGLVVDLDFSEELSQLTARDFVALLVNNLGMRGLVVGPDFAMGYQRRGTIPALRELGADLGFWVQVVEPVVSEQGPIRSSAVRQAISQGNMEGAAGLLGRAYSLTGKVVEGERRGNKLGFPTANLGLGPEIMTPGDGIYATWAVIDGERRLSATNVGIRPTFGSGPRTVEAFIMDFEQDIYSKALTLEFVSRLREELKFDSVDALIKQMQLDVDQARVILTGSRVPSEGNP